MRSLVNMLAEDKRLVTYRPRLNRITERVTATLLLQQILFRSQQVGWEPFYKFKSPCNHPLYREGDSWTEELGFSRREFDTALRSIGTKIKQGDSKEGALNGTGAQNLVIYWTDASRVTWYLLNVDLLERMLEELYAKGGNSLYQVKSEPALIRKSPKAQLPISETTTDNSREDSNSKLPFSSSSGLLEMTVTKLSRTFGDIRHQPSNVAQALNLWAASGLEEEDFVDLLEEAAAATKEAVSKSQVHDRGKRMAYFFAVVRERVGG